MVLKLYKSYIRPKLEYAYTVWNPYYVKDIEMIERVQRRVTRLPLELRDLPYETRLNILSLTTLRDRRTRDLIETYKIINGHYACNINFFHFSNNTNLRGHNYILIKERCSQLSQRNFFTNRVVHHWNRLSVKTVNSSTKNQFKNRLDYEMKEWNSFFVHYSA